MSSFKPQSTDYIAPGHCKWCGALIPAQRHYVAGLGTSRMLAIEDAENKIEETYRRTKVWEYNADSEGIIRVLVDYVDVPPIRAAVYGSRYFDTLRCGFQWADEWLETSSV